MTARPFAACSASVDVTLGQLATAAVVVATFGSAAAGNVPPLVDEAVPSSVAAPQPTASASPHAADIILALIVLSVLRRRKRRLETPLPAAESRPKGSRASLTFC